MGWNQHQQVPPRAGRLVKLGNCVLGVVEVFQDIDGEHRVEVCGQFFIEPGILEVAEERPKVLEMAEPLFDFSNVPFIDVGYDSQLTIKQVASPGFPVPTRPRKPLALGVP